ncbi:hypothetical protein SOVF_007070 [Spinacia oleracea]|nr:hypothetical protein SOVF_007070 [Spinacia oleracea]
MYCYASHVMCFYTAALHSDLLLFLFSDLMLTDIHRCFTDLHGCCILLCMLIYTGASSLRWLSIKAMLSGVRSIVEAVVELLKDIFPLSIDNTRNWQ